MVEFLKFKFLIALQLNFNGGQFYKYLYLYIKTGLFQKVEKSHNKIVKIEVENFEHFC